MNRACALLSLLLCGCGAADRAVPVPLALDLRGLTDDQVARIQLSVLARANRYSCATLRKSCLVEQLDGRGVDTADLVLIEDDEGRQRRSLLVTTDLAKMKGEGQTVTLKIPPGRDYLVIAEILSGHAELTASGCGALTEAREGDNAPVPVLVEETVTHCSDPRME